MTFYVYINFFHKVIKKLIPAIIHKYSNIFSRRFKSYHAISTTAMELQKSLHENQNYS